MKSKNIVPNYDGTAEEVTKRLEELVATKVREPNSLLAMLEFKRFMDRSEGRTNEEIRNIFLTEFETYFSI